VRAYAITYECLGSTCRFSIPSETISRPTSRLRGAYRSRDHSPIVDRFFTSSTRDSLDNGRMVLNARISSVYRRGQPSAFPRNHALKQVLGVKRSRTCLLRLPPIATTHFTSSRTLSKRRLSEGCARGAETRNSRTLFRQSRDRHLSFACFDRTVRMLALKRHVERILRLSGLSGSPSRSDPNSRDAERS